MKRSRSVVIVITLVAVALLAAASAGAARKSARLRTASAAQMTEQWGQPVSGNSYHEVLNGLFAVGGR